MRQANNLVVDFRNIEFAGIKIGFGQTVEFKPQRINPTSVPVIRIMGIPHTTYRVNISVTKSADRKRHVRDNRVSNLNGRAAQLVTRTTYTPNLPYRFRLTSTLGRIGNATDQAVLQRKCISSSPAAKRTITVHAIGGLASFNLTAFNRVDIANLANLIIALRTN
jgi:hypothetical protein